MVSSDEPRSPSVHVYLANAASNFLSSTLPPYSPLSFARSCRSFVTPALGACFAVFRLAEVW